VASFLRKTWNVYTKKEGVIDYFIVTAYFVPDPGENINQSKLKGFSVLHNDGKPE
jgi:hypothetical protein